MINRLIFLVVFPFNERDFARFGIEFLRQSGFSVEIWDAAGVSEYHRAKECGRFECGGLTRFCNKKDLRDRLTALSSKDFVINMAPYVYQNLHIYKGLSACEAFYAVFMANAMPKPSSCSVTHAWKRMMGLFPLNKKKILSVLFARIPFGFFKIKPARMILAGGAQCLMYNYPASRDTEILWCHAIDYDTYLKERHASGSELPMAVFLDQNLPNHRDYAIFKVRPFATKARYYPALTGFFELVKQQFSLDVVVAVHPRSLDEDNAVFFKGYRTVKGHTVKLIRDARLIMAHDTTALDMANLFYKPVIFLTSRELDATREGDYIKEMAGWFGKKAVNIDETPSGISWEDEMRVDKDIYDRYRDSYIKKEGSEETPFWQIVANRLKKGDI